MTKYRILKEHETKEFVENRIFYKYILQEKTLEGWKQINWIYHLDDEGAKVTLRTFIEKKYIDSVIDEFEL